MRLIDADTFVNMQMFDPEHEEWYTERMTIAECLDNYADDGCPPTIDAVEVVRCRDCEWYKTDYLWSGEEIHICAIASFRQSMRTPDDYCSYGERKSNE